MQFSSHDMTTGWAGRARSILRIVVAFLFIAHGTQKLFSFPAAMPGGTPSMSSQIGMAGLLETFGGLLVMVGLFTQPVAFVLSGEMAVAYFQAHAPRSVWPLVNNGEAAVLYCFVFLYFAVVGGGVWSVDRMRRRR